jgi:hypothetical protein
MQRINLLIALFALLGSVPAQAANDIGLTLHQNSQGAANIGGVGAQASLRIRLGETRTSEASDKLVLALHAGPIVSVQDRRSGAATRQITTNLASLNFRPGYSFSANLVGKPVATHLTRLGAAEGEGQDAEKPSKKQSTGNKAAWVALVAGGVMLIVVGVYVTTCLSGDCNGD